MLVLSAEKCFSRINNFKNKVEICLFVVLVFSFLLELKKDKFSKNLG